MRTNDVYAGNCLEILRQIPTRSVQCVVTSPPHWGAKSYGAPATKWPKVTYRPMLAPPTDVTIAPAKCALGLEDSPDEFIGHLLLVFRQIRRVLKQDGVVWLNMGDAFSRGGSAGARPKNLLGLPWRVAFALQADKWRLRSDVVWHNESGMPDPVKDRPTKAHEYVFLFSKAKTYRYDADAVGEHGVSPGGTDVVRRNCRSVWPFATAEGDERRFAAMPQRLAERCIMASTGFGDVVLDPFLGTGTTAMAAERLGRKWIGCEVNEKLVKLIRKRTRQVGLPFDASAHSAETQGALF